MGDGTAGPGRFGPQTMPGGCRGRWKGEASAVESDRSEVKAAYATPELETLFGEWLTALEAEIFQYAGGSASISAAEVAAHCSISIESATVVLRKVAKEHGIVVTDDGLQSGGV